MFLEDRRIVSTLREKLTYENVGKVACTMRLVAKVTRIGFVIGLNIVG
jgi:uncharacterized protein (UPF0210 family)